MRIYKAPQCRIASEMLAGRL